MFSEGDGCPRRAPQKSNQVGGFGILNLIYESLNAIRGSRLVELFQPLLHLVKDRSISGCHQHTVNTIQRDKMHGRIFTRKRVGGENRLKFRN